MTEIVYWFKNYQIDNTTPISENSFKITSTFNKNVMKSFFYGNSDLEINDEDLTSKYGQDKIYEIISFIQTDNLGTLNSQSEIKIIFSLIAKKQSAGIFNSTSNSITEMWLGVTYPKVICSNSNISDGEIKFWKINLDTIPMKKVMWCSTGVANSPKYGYLTSNGSKGDKILIGIVQKAFYLSPLSFYLEGIHEDILKKMPNLNGMGITNLTLN